MNRKFLWIGNIIGTALILTVWVVGAIRFYPGIHHIFATGHDASAIGIIGGADGPTAIFLSGPAGIGPVLLSLCSMLFWSVLFIFNVIYLRKNR